MVEPHEPEALDITGKVFKALGRIPRLDHRLQVSLTI
jgi:hypothetical protein